MNLINTQTGKPATDAEFAAATERALEIVRSPYSSPEQIEWALEEINTPIAAKYLKQIGATPPPPERKSDSSKNNFNIA